MGGEAPSKHWLDDQEVDAIFELYDKDRNGTISFDEFVHLAEDGVLLEGKLHEYECVFNTLDTDNDGTLSATEIRAAMRQLGAPEITMSHVREMLTTYDKDGNGEIDFHEFLRMFRSQLLDLHDVLEFLGMPPPASERPAKNIVSLKGLFVEVRGQ